MYYSCGNMFLFIATWWWDIILPSQIAIWFYLYTCRTRFACRLAGTERWVAPASGFIFLQVIKNVSHTTEFHPEYYCPPGTHNIYAFLLVWMNLLGVPLFLSLVFIYIFAELCHPIMPYLPYYKFYMEAKRVQTQRKRMKQTPILFGFLSHGFLSYIHSKADLIFMTKAKEILIWSYSLVAFLAPRKPSILKNGTAIAKCLHICECGPFIKLI